MSTPSNGSDSDGSSSIRKRGFSVPIDEEIEPYVRRRRNSSERNRKRLEKLTEEEQNVLRTSINSRERRRMHDLNDALDELRTVLPYSNGTTSRRLSKINTIILASNCIRNLNKRFLDINAENEQLRSMIPEEKLSTIKLPQLVATVTPTLSEETLLHPATKTRRLSSTPPSSGQKSRTPPIVNKPAKKPKTIQQPQQKVMQQSPTTPIFPMALLAAFNLQNQQQNNTPTTQFPIFHSPPHICMKRFNSSAFCACVNCFMQNSSLNAALMGRNPRQENR